jgi:hypothetical protein
MRKTTIKRKDLSPIYKHSYPFHIINKILYYTKALKYVRIDDDSYVHYAFNSFHPLMWLNFITMMFLSFILEGIKGVKSYGKEYKKAFKLW